MGVPSQAGPCFPAEPCCGSPPPAAAKQGAGQCPPSKPHSFAELSVGLQLRPPELELLFQQSQTAHILASDKRFGLISFFWLLLLRIVSPIKDHGLRVPQLALALLALQATQLLLLHRHPVLYLRARPLLIHAIWLLQLLNTLAAAHLPTCPASLPAASAPAALLTHNLLVHSLTFQSASFNISTPTTFLTAAVRTLATLLAALFLQAPSVTCILLHPSLAPFTRTPLLHAAQLLHAAITTATSHPHQPTHAPPPATPQLHFFTHTWLIFTIACLPLAYLHAQNRTKRRLFAILHLSTPSPAPTPFTDPTNPRKPPPASTPPAFSQLTYTHLTLTAERFERHPSLPAADIGVAAVLSECTAGPLLQCVWLLPPLLLLSATAAMALGRWLPAPLPVPKLAV